jgi:hypothetical protein
MNQQVQPVVTVLTDAQLAAVAGGPRIVNKPGIRA